MSEKILLADNDNVFLNTYTEILGQAGFEVITATTPQDTRNKLEDNDIDIAILDVRLLDDEDPKDFGGIRLAQTLPSELPIILITSHDEVVKDDIPPEKLPTTVVDLIPKGESPDRLLKTIRRTLLLSKHQEVPRTQLQSVSQRPIALVSIAVVILLLIILTGIIAVTSGNPNWLLASVVLAILLVLTSGGLMWYSTR